MTRDPPQPQYVAPPPDPALAILQQQNEQQQTLAIQDRTTSATARLMQTYGTRLATAGQNWSPLIAQPTSAAVPQMRGPRFQTDPAAGIM